MGMNQGISSKNVRHSTAPKREPRTHAKHPGGVSQYGGAQGDHVTTHGGGQTGYRGDPVNIGPGYKNPVGPTNMALQGPGAGCNIMKSGGQGTWGETNPGQPRPNRQRDALSNE
jgi:hypothetical protein